MGSAKLFTAAAGVSAAVVFAGATEYAAPFSEVWRAALVAATLSTAIHAIMAAIADRPLLTAAPAVAISFWVQGQPTITVGALVASCVIPALYLLLKRRRVAPERELQSVVAAFALILFVLVVVPYALMQISPPGPTQVLGGDAVDRPDIILIVLDGYPRADTLLTEYEFDNQPFLAALESRGFKVAERSRSNYNYTHLTLLSMFDMRHIVDMGLSGQSGSEQRWAIWRQRQDTAAIGRLQEHGYTIISVPSAYGELSLGFSDVEFHMPGLTAFEMARLGDAATHGPLGSLLAEPMADQHRHRLLVQLDELSAIKGGPEPEFLFAHVMLPHTPFVFGPDGEPRPLQGCLPETCGFWDGWESQLNRPDFAEAATDQIQYLNQRVLDLVDRLLARDDPPVVVLISDHGSRFDPDNADEMHRNFFASFTPGQQGLFSDDTTPISVFPRLLNAYLGENIAEPAPTEYHSDMRTWHIAPLEFTEFQEP